MQERRQAPRIFEETGIMVKIQSAPDAREIEGKSLPFNPRDISLEGLQLKVDCPVPVGSLLELKVMFNDHPDKFWHTGNVIWNNEATHMVGVKFNLADNPQYISWKEAISRLFA
jgi:hypothetical protein